MCDNHYLSCPFEIDDLKILNDKLNAKVLEQLNGSQELLMLNSFAQEANEYNFKNCLQERISDIASWRWVLQDLSKRLDEAVATLQYELNALNVVLKRIEVEMETSKDIKPGALVPLSDSVEEAVLEEYNYLRDQRTKFKNMISELQKHITHLVKTKSRIDKDILKKQETLSVEEKCINRNLNGDSKIDYGKKKKKRASPIPRWENRCALLKKDGLRALNNAIITRQQVRGARVQLSITAQAYAARTDSVLRRRLHTNKIKLQDLKWQKEETVRDFMSLGEELMTTERNLLETMEQERLVGVRLADRSLRPTGELTKDDVDRKLKGEMGRLRHFSYELRKNIDRITSLQNHLEDSASHTDCCINDIYQIVILDERRIKLRMGEEYEEKPLKKTQRDSSPTSGRIKVERSLSSIKEEDEADDYPFNY